MRRVAAAALLDAVTCTVIMVLSGGASRKEIATVDTGTPSASAMA